MAAKIQDGVQELIKTSQKHTFAYTILKFGSFVDQPMGNIKHILDIANIQYGG